MKEALILKTKNELKLELNCILIAVFSDAAF